jgi:hypothetical protein
LGTKRWPQEEGREELRTAKGGEKEMIRNEKGGEKVGKGEKKFKKQRT